MNILADNFNLFYPEKVFERLRNPIGQVQNLLNNGSANIPFTLTIENFHPVLFDHTNPEPDQKIHWIENSKKSFTTEYIADIADIANPVQILNLYLIDGVSCGGHNAFSCSDCPQGNGESWCKY